MNDDLALNVHRVKNGRPGLTVRLPVALSAALIEARYNRVKVTVTEEGILLRPYVSANGRAGHGAVAEIPDWQSE